MLSVGLSAGDSGLSAGLLAGLDAGLALVVLAVVAVVVGVVAVVAATEVMMIFICVHIWDCDRDCSCLIVIVMKLCLNVFVLLH